MTAAFGTHNKVERHQKFVMLLAGATPNPGCCWLEPLHTSVAVGWSPTTATGSGTIGSLSLLPTWSHAAACRLQQDTPGKSLLLACSCAKGCAPRRPKQLPLPARPPCFLCPASRVSCAACSGFRPMCNALQGAARQLWPEQQPLPAGPPCFPCPALSCSACMWGRGSPSCAPLSGWPEQPLPPSSSWTKSTA